MDPINIILAVNLFVTMSANMSGAKKGMKAKLSTVMTRPKTYLQKVPPNVAALVLVLTIAAIFNLGTLSEELKADYSSVRIIGLLIFIVFSWLQVAAFKSLGENYSQDIVIFRKHDLKTDGMYKFIRHPQYVSQLLSDLGAGIALMGYLIIPIVILVEIPLFFLRAKKEDQLFSEHFSEGFVEYRQKSGFFIPFIG